MTKPWLSICVALCLLSMGCSSSVPKPLIPPSTPHAQPCPLVACRLPARPPVLVNEQWQDALLGAEDALKLCAAQVLACMQQQGSAGALMRAEQGMGPSGG